VLNNEELTAENINIFPNPSNGIFEIEGLPTGTEYSVYSMDGKIIQSASMTTQRTIDLSHAAPGYYIFQAGQIRKPLIIQ
jgi:hypothetical protein